MGTRKTQIISDAEITRVYNLAYKVAVVILGDFQKPRLVIKRRLRGAWALFCFSNETITISRETPDTEHLLKTCLHELAHAYLHFESAYHGELWLQVNRKLGGVEISS